jgi:hypothetical protein
MATIPPKPVTARDHGLVMATIAASGGVLHRPRETRFWCHEDHVEFDLGT